MFTKPLSHLRHFAPSERGQALAEYGLVLALVAIVCVAIVTALGLAVAGDLGNVAGAL
ncbi:MAG TPA: Flp family type IVb pilin [Dehalococcoidia bacterium]|nr:Flp family type IVb pilin [Dehalococcoidia bacterium]